MVIPEATSIITSFFSKDTCIFCNQTYTPVSIKVGLDIVCRCKSPSGASLYFHENKISVHISLDILYLTYAYASGKYYDHSGQIFEKHYNYFAITSKTKTIDTVKFNSLNEYIIAVLDYKKAYQKYSKLLVLL